MKQGEIWLIDLDPTVGAEMNKTRPAVIVNNDKLGRLPLKIIAPVTDWKEHYSNYPWMVKINPTEQNCLVKISAVDCFQVRSISVERFITKVGFVESEITVHVQEAIIKVIGAQ